ncbi:MAG: cytochrome b/b6 domain-containing protein [Lamprocystis purpurea]|jgi:cytochrome b|uniref:cytochrome b/b6 domain-containing protein n=1 Tax=Lamprocystis purpurea TaxID=61598 RepID=UPI00035E0F4B|nr:cytochrome b/b6 domain-containing protein [Lamprocystis purpurea]MBV5273126.1 cytochrome b/b6 domain-containing protein [Lamprocystis purpurea]
MSNTNEPVAGHQGPRATATPSADRVRVWDPFVRFFHWALGAAVLIAFLTEDELLGLHTWAGYAALALIGARLLWGLIGPRHARWWDFVCGPRVTLAYLGDVLRGRADRYLGHNPAGAAMVIALLTGVTATAVTGMAVLGAGEFAGPLAPYLRGVSATTAHDLKEVHEFIAYATLFLIPLHVLGVVLASLQHRENLIRGMIDGYKRGASQ